jgi:DNA polymerase-4
MTIEAATDEAKTIRLAAGLCLKRVDLARRIRLLGVRVSALRRAGSGGTRPAPALGSSPA